MAPKDTNGGTVTAEQEQAAPAPQTAEQIKDTETAIGVRTGIGAPAKVSVRMGLSPTSLEEAWRMATFMAQSLLVPKQYQKQPADILVAIQYGMELGFPPMQALQSIAVINGRPSVWGDGFLALIMASPLYRDHDEFFEVDGKRVDSVSAEDLKKDATTAVCIFHRNGKSTPTRRDFSVAKAKTANLWGKQGPWQQYPDVMLMARARGFAGRATFPDLLRGIKTAEEAMDTPPEETFDVEPAKEVRRISETPAEAPKTIHVPKVEEVTLDAAKVSDVLQFMGGFTVVLSNGMKVDATDMADAVELEKFKGTDHRVRLHCTKSGDALQLKSFAIAD